MGIFLDGKHLLFNLHLAQDGFGFLRKSKPFIGIHGISFVWLRPLILSVSVIVWGDIASVYYPCCSLVSFLGFSDPLLPLSVKCVCLIFTLHSTVKSQNVHLWILNMHLLKCDVSLISEWNLFIHVLESRTGSCHLSMHHDMTGWWRNLWCAEWETNNKQIDFRDFANSDMGLNSCLTSKIIDKVATKNQRQQICLRRSFYYVLSYILNNHCT